VNRVSSLLLFLALTLAVVPSPLPGQVNPAQRRRLNQAPPGSLSGLVWDSTQSRPLAGARVVVFGTEHSTVTDSTGRFLLPEIPAGLFSVAFNHPRLDTLFAFPSAVEVEVQSQIRSEILLGVPSLGTIMAATCAFQRQPEGTSPLVGTVQVVPTGNPLPGARVALRREGEPLSEAGSTARDRLPMVTRTDSWGRYTLCGVPTAGDLTLQAAFFGHQSTPSPVRFTEGNHAVVDLGISLPPGFLVTRSGADIRVEGTGTQGVQGWIREPESDAPVEGAEVTLRQTPGTIVVTGVTNSRGFFRLQTPVLGTYSLEARALGYGEARAEDLTVSLGKLTVLEIAMAPAPLELEPLVAVGEPRVFQLEMQGFYNRKEAGFGYFITPDQLERWTPMDFGQLFSRVPGIRVSTVSGVGTILTILRPSYLGGPECTPRLYLDGAVAGSAPFAGDTTGIGVVPDQLVSVRDLEAVEFYRGAATVPLVWSTMGDADCGTIVLWTKIGSGGN
jgi:hypothetical protein